MIGFRHVESGAIHFAETADGYGEPEWAALGPLPEGVPTDLVLWSDDAGSFVEDLATVKNARRNLDSNGSVAAVGVYQGLPRCCRMGRRTNAARPVRQ